MVPVREYYGRIQEETADHKLLDRLGPAVVWCGMELLSVLPQIVLISRGSPVRSGSPPPINSSTYHSAARHCWSPVTVPANSAEGCSALTGFSVSTSAV